MNKECMALISPVSQDNPSLSLQDLKPGDTLVIQKINGIGHSQDKDVSPSARPIELFLIQDDGASAGTPPSRYDMSITVVSTVQKILAQLEQAESQKRKTIQAQGITKAQAKGVRFGRPAKSAPENFGPLVAQWEQGQLTLPQLLEQTGLKQATFFKLLRAHRNACAAEQ